MVGKTSLKRKHDLFPPPSSPSLDICKLDGVVGFFWDNIVGSNEDLLSLLVFNATTPSLLDNVPSHCPSSLRLFLNFWCESDFYSSLVFECIVCTNEQIIISVECVIM